MRDSKRIQWGDLGQLFDGPHATPTRVSEGPYFLNISSLKSGRLDLSESDHVSDDDFAKWTRRVTPRENDLLFSYETRLGEAALMPPGVEACLGRRMALLRPDPGVIVPRYLLYLYLSPGFQRIIATHTIHGATVPRIGLATMPEWEVEIPSLDDQRAIAEVLGALDDKIAANQLVIRLLDKIGESAVIQKASTVSPVELRAVADLAYGKALPVASRSSGNVLVYGSGGVVGSHDTALVDEPGIVVGRKGTVGALYWAAGPHFPIDTTYYVVPKQGVSPYVLFFALRKARLKDLNSDSAVPGLNREEAYGQYVSVPAGSDSEQLADQLKRQFALAASIRDESQRLAETRDRLLPLLMSGKVTVKNIEGDIGDIV